MLLSFTDATFRVLEITSTLRSLDDPYATSLRNALMAFNVASPLQKVDVVLTPPDYMPDVAIVLVDGRSWNQQALEKTFDPPEKFTVVGAWRASEYVLLKAVRDSILNLLVHHALEKIKVRFA